MDNETIRRIKDIEFEDMVFVVFIVIIIMSYIANDFEKKFFVYRDEEDKRTYYYLQIIIFLIIVVINIYYVLKSLKDVSTLSINDSFNRKKYAKLDLIASISALVATSIILYIAITDKDIEAEITL